jgi:hypothetical protein
LGGRFAFWNMQELPHAVHVVAQACSQEEFQMRRAVILAGAVALLGTSQTFAQTVGVRPADTIIVEPEQRQVIKQYVVKEKVAPVRVPQRVVIGDTLPADVELRSVPTTWGPKLTRYRYIYSGNHVYLVEPSDRKVIEEIE